MVKYLPEVQEDLAHLFLPLDQLLPVHSRENILPNQIKVIYVDNFVQTHESLLTEEPLAPLIP